MISVVRVLLVPVVVWLVLLETEATSWLAVGLYAIAGLTDGLDGYLARRHGMTTPTGAWLDPLSDKLLVVIPAIALSMVDAFPWWATIAFGVREIAVTLLRWHLDARGGVSMPASGPAKAKTLSQLVAVGAAMAPLAPSADPLVLVAIVVAVALTLYTGAEYFLTTRHRVEA